MALKQIVPIFITLQGDGTSTAFVYAIQNIYQAGTGNSIPFGGQGVVPSSAIANNPPVPITSVAVDANGNLTITLTSALANGVQATFEIDLVYNSGAASSSSPSTASLVTLTGTSTVVVSGTAAVTQSTTPWIVAGTLTHNNAAPGATNIGALVGVASSAAPTYTAGDQVLLSTDLAGNLRVTFAAAGEQNVNVNEWAGTTLGSPSNYGTSPGAVEVPGVNAFVTNTVAVSGTVAVTQSTSPWVVSLTSTTITGTVAVTQSTSPWVVSNGGTFAVQAAQSGTWGVEITGHAGATLDASVTPNTAPTNGIAVLGVSPSVLPTLTGGQSASLQLDVSGRLNTDTQALAGTQLGAPSNYGTSPGAVAVAGVNAFVTNTVAVTLTSTTITGTVAENLTEIAGNAVVTAASGVLKVGIVGNAGATLDSTIAAGTAPTNGLAVIAQYNTTQPAPTAAQTVALQVDQGANLLTYPGQQFKTGAAWSSSTSAGTFQYPSGTTTAGGQDGTAAYLIQLDQTSTLTAGAVTFQGTYDGTNWVTIPTTQVLNPSTFDPLSNPYSFVASTQQPFLVLIGGYSGIRLDLSTAITGTGTVTPYWAGFSVSPLQFVRETKDQNRTFIAFIVNNIASVTTEALASMSINKAGTVTTATTYTVTAGKTLRLQSFSVACLESNTVGKVRGVTTGTATATSPVLMAVATTGFSANQDVPDGLELPGGSNFGITQIAGATGNFFTATLIGYEY